MSQPQTECDTCREPIRADALKCIKCDSYRDWRRFLPASASTLALVIALISVISSLGPGILRMIEGERSALTVSYVAPMNDGILLLASNPGTRPAIVHRISPVEQQNFIAFELKPKDEPIVIGAGQVRIIGCILRVIDDPDGAYAAFGKQDKHPIYVHATQFGGQKDTIELRIPQRDLFRPVMEGRDFLRFERNLLDPYMASHIELLDRLDPRAIERIRPDILDQLSPEMIERLKRAYRANQPKTLMQR